MISILETFQENRTLHTLTGLDHRLAGLFSQISGLSTKKFGRVSRGIDPIPVFLQNDREMGPGVGSIPGLYFVGLDSQDGNQ